MNCVESRKGVRLPPPPPSRLHVTIFSSRFLGLISEFSSTDEKFRDVCPGPKLLANVESARQATKY